MIVGIIPDQVADHGSHTRDVETGAETTRVNWMAKIPTSLRVCPGFHCYEAIPFIGKGHLWRCPTGVAPNDPSH